MKKIELTIQDLEERIAPNGAAVFVADAASVAGVNGNVEGHAAVQPVDHHACAAYENSNGNSVIRPE